jgi:pimeloyl-ACP methyl ester carboxylesterase
VIFEAGAATPLESWATVVKKLPKTLPWVAYTRPGIEGTEWDKVQPTPEHVSTKLLELLQVMKVRPPYVVVGHSWGGVLARYFVGNHKNLVAGVVYLDPGPLVTHTKDQELAVFRAIGSDEKGMEAMFTVPDEMRKGAPDFVAREFDTFTSLMKRELPDRKVPSAPDVPSVMVLAGRYSPHPWPVPFDHRRYFDTELKRRLSGFSEWILPSKSGKLELHRDLDHSFPWTHPDVVVRAIEYVLSKYGKPSG